VYSLMFNSISIINPSLFEGWSTTVEEAKTYGKNIILSDIPVHREQSPERCIYFDSSNAGELANIVLDIWSSYDRKLDEDYTDRSLKQLPNKMKKYATDFEGILLNINKNR